MTSDIRNMLREAAGTDEEIDSGARAAIQRGEWLRWRKRMRIPTAIAVAAALAISALQIPEIQTWRLEPVAPGQTESKKDERPAREPKTEQARDEEDAPEVADEPPELADGFCGLFCDSETEVRQEAATCATSTVQDDFNDTEHVSIDIIESAISYDKPTNTLVFTHRMQNIDDYVPSARWGYDMHFEWWGLKYHAEARILETGERFFGVARAGRSDDVSNAVTLVEVMHATGEINFDTEMVTLSIQLDEFNEGEDRVSAEEGMPPPGDLKKGSEITSLDLHTYSRTADAKNYEDRADGWCSHFIGQE